MTKDEIQAKFARYVHPNRVQTWREYGIDLVIGRREGYRFFDLDGREFIDVHLNGGTYNLGHRHPEVVAALIEAAAELDVGNHHFASVGRALLGEELARLTGLRYSVFASGGSEAVDIAVKASRWATGRRRVVAMSHGYHGRTGISGAAGDDKAARFFLSDDPTSFTNVPFDDADAIRAALAPGDVACVLLEPIPATYGFPLPSETYLTDVRAACDATGTMLVADEIQTGLMRTGRMWAVDGYGVRPDVLTTTKGLSGGMYPISAAVLNERCGGWLEENGWVHVNTFGGAEIGCAVALKALEIYSRPQTAASVARVAGRIGDGLSDIQRRRPYLAEIRQRGLVIGLRFDDPIGGQRVMKALFDAGVWAILADFDRSVLQFKPGLLLEDWDCDRILDALDKSVAAAARAASWMEAASA